jgi:hypothetical protein
MIMQEARKSSMGPKKTTGGITPKRRKGLNVPTILAVITIHVAEIGRGAERL